MEILIEIIDSQVEVKLINKNEVVDSINWIDDRSLSENLLIKLDKLLKRNKLDVKEIEKFSHKVNMDETYSTYRIAEATVKTLNYCKSSE